MESGVTNLAFLQNHILSIRLVVALDSANISHQIAFLKLNRAHATSSWLDAMDQLNSLIVESSGAARTSNHPMHPSLDDRAALISRRPISAMATNTWWFKHQSVESRMERVRAGGYRLRGRWRLDRHTWGAGAMAAVDRQLTLFPAGAWRTPRAAPGFVLLPRTSDAPGDSCLPGPFDQGSCTNHRRLAGPSCGAGVAHPASRCRKERHTETWAHLHGFLTIFTRLFPWK